MHYKSIFISDTHLGSKEAKAKELLHFLSTNTCEKLYLIGDIIDGWKIQQNRWHWKKSHSDVVRQVLKMSRKNTQVFYIAGNHDEFLRPMIPYNADFGNIKVMNQTVHEAIDGKKFLVVHGDLFDGISRVAKWLSFLGDRAYDILLSLNNYLHWWRHKFGLGYWSLSQYLKHRVKGAVNFIFEFEENLSSYCKRKGYDGVICGHIHKAEIKEINGVIYMNDGDWVESCTALVETVEGEWKILTYEAQNEMVSTDSGNQYQ